jgi:hypothetical protein
MGKQKKHKGAKGTVKSHGATFRIIEKGKFLRNEPQRKPRKDQGNGERT